MGATTRPDPMDRRETGTRRHIIAGGSSILFCLRRDRANVHNNASFDDLLDAVSGIAGKRGRQRLRPTKLCAAKVGDHPRCRRARSRRRSRPRIARRGIETGKTRGRHKRGAGHASTWIDRGHRLTNRYGHSFDTHHLLTAIVCPVACNNILQSLLWKVPKTSETSVSTP